MDCQGIVHYEFVPQGTTVDKDMYIDILFRLRDVVRMGYPKSEEPKVGFSFMTMLRQLAGFG